MEERKVTVKFEFDNELIAAVLIFCIFASCWLFVGEPDLMDAIISFLMKGWPK